MKGGNDSEISRMVDSEEGLFGGSCCVNVLI